MLGHYVLRIHGICVIVQDTMGKVRAVLAGAGDGNQGKKQYRHAPLMRRVAWGAKRNSQIHVCFHLFFLKVRKLKSA